MGRVAIGVGVCALLTGALGAAGTAAGASAAPSCGAVVKGVVVLQTDLVDCRGDGLIVGAPNTRIDLNGHLIRGTTAAGSVGIRFNGRAEFRIESSKPFAAIQQFEVGIKAADVQRLVVRNVMAQALLAGVQLDRVRSSTISGSNVGFAERVSGCDPATSATGI